MRNEKEKLDVKSKKCKKPFYKRVWFIVVAVLLLIIGGMALSMPFSYGVQTVILRIACTPRNVSTPDNYEEICDNTTVIADIEYTSVYGNNYLDIITPKEFAVDLPILVYFHGGYYVGGDKSGKEPYLRAVANEGYIVANVNYELVPDAQYPAQVIQADEALKYLVGIADDYHFDSDKIFIGGDSAGAHLSGQLGALYTNTQLQQAMDITPSVSAAQIKGVVLLCGFYNMFTVRETGFPFLNDAMWMLTGVKEYETYSRVNELNTINNVTADYPATYLLCGSDDPFYSQNVEMKAKLDTYGVTVSAYLPISDGYKLEHEFQCDFTLNESYTAMDILIEFMENRCL